MTPEERAYQIVSESRNDDLDIELIIQAIRDAECRITESMVEMVRSKCRQAAESMRERCAVAAGAWTRNLVNAIPDPIADRVSKEIANAIRALPIE